MGLEQLFSGSGLDFSSFLSAGQPLSNQEFASLSLRYEVLFGLGVGTINAKAISIISERYHGKTRIQMLVFTWINLKIVRHRFWLQFHGSTLITCRMDGDLLGLQCGVFSIDPLSALLSLAEEKKRNKRERDRNDSFDTGRMKA